MENLNLLKKIAWSFHSSTGLDWNDLFQEAYLAYLYALTTYKPESGAHLSTFIWKHVSNQLTTYYNKEKRMEGSQLEINPSTDKTKKNFTAWVSDDPVFPEMFLESLTTDSQEIVEIIMTSMLKFVRMDRRSAKQRIINVLKNRGWSMTRIYYAFRNIRSVCYS